MTEEEWTEEWRKVFAKLMKEKLSKMHLHPAPYRPDLGLTLELHKKRVFEN